MGRKIVVLSDGTGNSSAKLQKTNVWRLFQAIDQTSADVIARYDDGVGSSSNKYLAALGGVFGFGLRRNVLDLYKFVCRNYKIGDDIYGFGFSRGAFTIRVLMDLIGKEGLVPFRSEAELSHNAAAAYRHYRSHSFPTWSPIVGGLRYLRDGVIWLMNLIGGRSNYADIKAETKANQRHEIKIRFLGLWDTVEAYGLPITELKRGIDWVLWPMMFGDFKLSPSVQRACHALSLDDERTSFHPLPWDEAADAELVTKGKVDAGRLTQVWFAGVHANVGGGYSEDQLAMVPLEWIVTEAQAAGLPFANDCLKRLIAEKSPYARLYNSRAGLGSYYRYTPRRMPDWHYGNAKIHPIVHGSVIMRMIHGSDQYAPLPLPESFWVLRPDGQLTPIQDPASPLKLDAGKKAQVSTPALRDPPTLAAETAALDVAIKKITRPDASTIALVWDTVWWRRLVYFVTVALTFIVATYPWTGGLFINLGHALLRHIPVVGENLSKSIEMQAQQGDGQSRGLIAPLVDAVSGFVPSYLKPWTEAFLTYPVEFGSIVILILCCLYISSVLQGRIHDRARLSWHQGNLGSYMAWAKGDRQGMRSGLLVAFGVAIVLCIATSFLSESWSAVRQIAVIAFIFLLLIMYVAADWLRARHRAKTAGHPTDPLLRGSIALSVARALRNNRPLVKTYRGIFLVAVPIGFALLIVLGLTYLANRILFDAYSAAGYVCNATDRGKTGDGKEPPVQEVGTKKDFQTDQLCWPTGFVLQAGRRYRITLDTPGDWFDRTTRTDVLGFPVDNFTHFIATPMKRWWFQNWFKPIAHIGAIGNDEYALDPVDAPEPQTYCTAAEESGGLPAGSPAKPPTARPSNSRLASERTRVACLTCPAEKAQTVAGGGTGFWDKKKQAIAAKITDSSRQALMTCSPTPAARQKLEAVITARTTGELFLFVNDAVWMVPNFKDAYYRNNSGTATVTVKLEQGAAATRP